MILKSTILAGVIAAAAFTAVPANAGVSFGIDFGATGIYFDDQMSPGEVRHMLHRYGYHDIEFIDDEDDFYKLTATKHGDDYFIVVNSHTGAIVHRHET